MEVDTLLLSASLLMIFIGVFGGGFEIKGVKIPKVPGLSRILGLILGGVLLIYSQCFLQGYFPSYCDEKNDADSNESGVALPSSDLVPKEKYKELEEAWENLSISNAMLFEEYRSLQKPEHYGKLSITEKDQLTRQVNALKESIVAFDSLKLKDNSLLTNYQKLKLWQESGKIARLSDEDKALADTKIKQYQTALASWASIAKPGDFVTCEGIRQKMPFTIKKNFGVGEAVSIWGRVNVPATNELLKLEWVDSRTGQPVRTLRDIKVYQSDGYRIFYKKTFHVAGIYEARLFNSQNQLIGQRKFIITNNLTRK